uniref:uncharacterized protein LOC120326357 n=1 Tax=Styela clava TaxID=7725 RepID=UPI00193AD8DA|nr:uncharacterized protein LOC120326357 [Styela clava]
MTLSDFYVHIVPSLMFLKCKMLATTLRLLQLSITICIFLLQYFTSKMPSNVEIKAKVKNFDAFLKLAKEISGQEGTLLCQTDTFFVCPNGRLKLRCFKNEGKGQLIFYTRPDQSGPKLSEFFFTTVNNPEELKQTLTSAYGTRGEVRKRRTLFLVGQTRIHADEVDGLGTYMELEVQMQSGQSVEEGNKIAKDLMKKLGIEESDLITGAYMDLLLKKQQNIE